MSNPTDITYYPRDNLILSKIWKDSNSKYHRIDAPAVIDYGLNSEILRERWYRHGKYYRENGPAAVSYYENGDIKSEYWYIRGEKGRFEGPAEIDYFGGNGVYKAGEIQYEEWWINGIAVCPLYSKWPLTSEQQIEMKLKYG